MPTSPIESYAADKLEPAYAPELSRTNAFKVAAGTYLKGTVCGIVDATGAAKTYANGNSDGSERAQIIAQYDMYSNGTYVSLTDGGALLVGESAKDAPFYVCGFFNCDQLTGLDSNALADPGWRLIGANTVSGVVGLF